MKIQSAVKKGSLKYYLLKYKKILDVLDSDKFYFFLGMFFGMAFAVSLLFNYVKYNKVSNNYNNKTYCETLQKQIQRTVDTLSIVSQSSPSYYNELQMQLSELKSSYVNECLK